jgi:hypothetical protein
MLGTFVADLLFASTGLLLAAWAQEIVGGWLRARRTG